MKHVEGGYTSSRIQELVIIERLIKSIFLKYSFCKVIEIYDIRYRLDSIVLKDFLLSNKVQYRRIHTSFLSNMLSAIFYLTRPLLYEPYRFMNFVRFNLFSKKKSPIGTGNIIAISLNSDAQKILELYNNFCLKLDDQEIDYVFISNGVSKNSRHIKSIKDKVYLQEHYENIFDYFKSTMMLCLFTFRLIKNKNFILNKLCVDNKVIANQLYLSIFYHIVIDTGFRYRYNKSFNFFLNENHNKILAFKLWGGVSLHEGEIEQKIIKKSYQNIKTIAFEGSNGLKEFPYMPEKIKEIDFIITSNDMESDLYLNYGVKKERILQLINFKNKTHLSNSKDCHYTVNDSIKFLEIPQNNYKGYILVDVSVSMRGYLSNVKIDFLINKINALSKKFIKYLFLIKPHPRFKFVNHLDDKFKNSPNVIVFDKGLSIFHLLNVADVFITRSSTAGLDAIMLEKLVISVLSDNEKKFAIFGDAAIYIDNYNDIEEILMNFKYYKKNIKPKVRLFQNEMLNTDNSIGMDVAISKIKER